VKGAVDNKWPRRAFRNKIYRFIAAGVFCYLVSIVFILELYALGSISIPHGALGNYSVSGNEARSTICLFLFIGTLLLFISIYYFIKYKRLIKTESIAEDYPLPDKFVICGECKEVFEGYTINNYTCPKCNGKIISINDYRVNYSTKHRTSNNSSKYFLLFIVLFFIFFGSLILTQIILYFKIHSCKESGGRYYQEINECRKIR
jgi:hypothetical protein